MPSEKDMPGGREERYYKFGRRRRYKLVLVRKGTDIRGEIVSEVSNGAIADANWADYCEDSQWAR